MDESRVSAMLVKANSTLGERDDPSHLISHRLTSLELFSWLPHIHIHCRRLFENRYTKVNEKTRRQYHYRLRNCKWRHEDDETHLELDRYDTELSTTTAEQIFHNNISSAKWTSVTLLKRILFFPIPQKISHCNSSVLSSNHLFHNDRDYICRLQSSRIELCCLHLINNTLPTHDLLEIRR